MASCDILDLKCILVNEIFGNLALAVIGGTIFYLIIAGKLRWGSETTIAFMIPAGIILGMMIGGFQVIYAFATLLVALLITILFNKLIQNR